MKPQWYNAVYYLVLTVLAQNVSVSILSSVGGTFSTLLCICCCFVCCYWYFKWDPGHTRREAHANRNRRLTSHNSHTSMVTCDPRSQKGVEPHSRGNTAAPHASASGHRQVPIYAPAPPQYELCVYNTAAPPPYLSLFPPYTAQLVQHSQVHTIDSGAEVRAEPALYAVSGSEVHIEVENGAEVQAEHILHAASDSYSRNVGESVEMQAQPIPHDASSFETPKVENQEMQLTSSPRPELEIQMAKMDFQAGDESSVFANPCT